MTEKMKKGKKERKQFAEGVRDGLPIALGYFAVAFSLGIVAKRAGLTPFEGFLASILTNASAGENAGFLVIRENSGLAVMALMTLVASSRYFLMACSLSQKFDPNMPFRHRLLIAFDLTDEIFGAQIARPGFVCPAYTYGLFVLPLIGWSSGTALGIVTGNALPANIVSALSVALYGMFIAIVVPPAKKDKVVAGTVIVSLLLSFAFSRLPFIRDLSEGVRILILTVLISALAAFFFPIKDEEEQQVLTEMTEPEQVLSDTAEPPEGGLHE